MRSGIALIIEVLLCGLGFWLGEGGLLPWAMALIASGCIGCSIVVFLVPGRAWKKTLAGTASLLLFAVAYFFGTQSFGRAFNECVARGEEVRTALKEHRAKKSQYPESLEQLESPIPCGRFTRPTILEYQRTKSGYVLTFRDWLIEHVASESDAFIAKK